MKAKLNGDVDAEVSCVNSFGDLKITLKQRHRGGNNLITLDQVALAELNDLVKEALKILEQ